MLRRAPRLRVLPLLVVFTKSDLPNAKGTDALAEALSLSMIQQPGPDGHFSGQYKFLATSAADGRGIEAGLLWLTNRILGREHSDIRVERT